MAGGSGDTSTFGPGLWVVDSEKVYQGEYWTNRYIVQAPDLAAAHAIAMGIVATERSAHQVQVLFTKVRTSDGQPNTDVYQVTNINEFGQRAATGDLLPLFNVVRVDFNVSGGGRPSRKYLRGILTESDISFNTIITGTVTSLETLYATPLAALTGFVDVDGQEIVSGQVYPNVAMRQLRRGSKRKAAGTNP